MKRRLVIAVAIMHDPPVLFLDEPTSGIDAESSRMIRSMLAVAVTFEKKQRHSNGCCSRRSRSGCSCLPKHRGAAVFGMFNATVPVLLGFWFADLSGVAWNMVIPAVLFMAITSTFLSLMLAILATEVFEVQTLSNFVRFPMIFLCGLFFR